MKTVPSICSYCGCSCRLNFVVENGKIVKTLPDNTDPVSEGRPCIKGLTLHEVIYKDRILEPMIREKKGSKLKKVSWKEAYEFIYKKTKNLAPEEIFFSPSGKTVNENSYVMQKFGRIVFKTNHIDGCCSRLCHIATVRGLKNTFGIAAVPSKMNDVHSLDCLFIIGSNPASNYPVVFNRILKAKQKGLKVISIQCVAALISQQADVSLVIQPGAETLLLNAISNLIIQNGAYDKKLESVDGFKRLRDTVKKYTEDIVCKVCGISHDDWKNMTNMILKSKSFGVMHGMGITQHVNALENIHSLLNMMILKNGQMLSLRGEVNVQGVGDMGCMPDSLPCGELVEYSKLEKIWGTKVPKEKGKNIMEALLISPAKAVFIAGFNPAQSMPDLNKVHKNFKRMFIVQLESHPNLTTDFADVVLPIPTLVEKTGTIANGERRIRHVGKVIEPVGKSKSEWIIFKELAELFGFGKFFNYKDEKEILKEIIRVVPSYSEISPEVTDDQWAEKEIKFLKFNPEQFEGVEDVRSKKYPFILTTFRSQYHFLMDEMTSKSPTLSKNQDGPFCYMNEDDAKRLKIKDGDKIKVFSYVGSVITQAKIDKRIPEKTVGMYFHFKELLVNKLFPTQFDEETFTPNYKLVAVQIQKIR